MASEGWNKKSIADCLKLSRSHVYTILEAFEREGFAGLEDQRTRPSEHPDNQLSLPLFKEVLDFQHEYPRAGRFRIHGLLEQQHDEPPPSERTVGRAMAINRQFHGAPGPWRSARDDQPAERLPLSETLSGSLEGVCRFDSRSCQTLGVPRQSRGFTLGNYGEVCPQALVSDNGSVLTAGDYIAILRDLEIEPLHIEKGKPWQNLIEAQFKVQLRLADCKFEQAETLGEVQAQHAAFIETFNTTSHWAHRHRGDGDRTPVAVLGWLRGRRVEPKRLRELFGRTGFLRTVNRYGFVSVQRFYIYAENGLSRQRVSIWIYEGELSIAYQQTLLARYRCAYAPKHRQLQDVNEPILYATPFASPQLELIELDDAQWIKFQRRPSRHYSRRIAMLPQQLSLIDLGTFALVLLAFKAI